MRPSCDKTRTSRRLAFESSRAVLLSLLLLAPTVAAALPAESAVDICAADADPCLITGTVDLADHADLDFSTRNVEVHGGGKIRFGDNGGTLRCGGFTTEGATPGIEATGDGRLTIEARRQCDHGPADATCFRDSNCQLGPCGVRRCSGDSQTLCTSDAACSIGPCDSLLRRCTGTPDFVRCSSNTDCELGPCASETTCTELANGPVSCASDADCDRGSCSVGDGSIHIGAPIEGGGSIASSVRLEAAGGVEIAAPVRMSSQLADEDAGELEIRAWDGDITVSAPFVARGGFFGTGGSIDLNAGGDVAVLASIDVSSDFGGDVTIRSGGDAAIAADISSNARNGYAQAGSLYIDAGGDVTFARRADGKRVRISSNGCGMPHTNEAEGGDGGWFDINADGDIAVEDGVRFLGNGGRPGGFASEFYFDAGGDFTFDGEVIARGRGTWSYGGIFAAFVDGAVSIGPSVSIRADGGRNGGSALEISAGDNLTYEGYADLRTRGTEGSSDAWLHSDRDMHVTGRIRTSGDSYTSIELEACRIQLAQGADLDNRGEGGTNSLTVGENMTLAAGSSLLAENGSNILTYRAAEKPPVVAGVVNTAPQLVLDPLLAGCPVCGNLEVDEGESCDDGNVSPRDGCDADCQLE